MDATSTIEKMRTTNERTLRTYALVHGITKIEVVFSGGGDSGQIDDVSIYTGSQLFSVDNKIVAWQKSESVFNTVSREWEDGPIKEGPIPIHDFVREFVYEALSNCNVDWYNNEGGQGTWVWSPNGGIDFHVYYNETQEILGFSEHRQLGEEAA